MGIIVLKHGVVLRWSSHGLR